ncbi:SusC/RagA family TonB-linked outer membrane protein [Sphingobacterium hungaricum]|uniref:TonB-dependent receptor plug domain-containing protein n=1 Tax=Sphingobacterium hungaricum TaxID=2082723 RepID=A0A928UWA1_9SPHI|nr:SusC/RagA family TonB-linked outer membrane protein [Sphingobacterium hungaricum]MBE8713118.1 hypothetical protein [Sphingobacterium hungaricum]
MKQKLLSVFVLCMLLIGASYAQTKQIRGKVTSATTGEPIAGASVLIQGTNQGTQTDANGDFSITFPSTSTHLEIRYIGYLTQTFAVGSRNFAEIRLSVVENSLEEVVVTGAGLTAQRKAIGNAQTTVKSDDILQAKPMNVVTGLTGKVPGLVVQGVSSGVNPNYRVVLRGMRSLTGNNEALIVVDNVIAPSSILGNLNPDDIVDITVLNGSGAAALYGSAASNGALIITTKKGKSSEGFEINLENSSIFEEVSFLPQVQTLFGSGSAADFPVYVPYENQQYGPAFDGSIVEIGSPLEDGSIQTVPYVYSSGKDDFWELGYNNQTSLSLSSRSEKSSFHLAGQYLQATGTVPFDKYNRATARVSGVNNITDKLTSTYSAYVAQNNYDITSEADLVYEYVLNTPGQIPLTDYEDFINNPFATPDGYFNMYYNNPYFVAANNRNLTKNNYLLGNIELKYNPTNWLDVLGRIGYTSSYQNRKLTSGVYLYSDYSKTLPSSYKDEDLLGSVEDEFSYNTKLVTDFIAHATHTNYEIKFDYTAIGQYIQNQYSMVNAAVEGLAVPDLYNLDNSLNNAEVEGPRYLARTIGLAGKIDLAYKNFLFLSLTGRNDWTSILDPGNRSYFYPSASLSFVPTDAFAALKNVNALDFLKLRTGWSRVGQVNLGNATDFGAYYLEPTFSQGSGYPYDGIGGHSW